MLITRIDRMKHSFNNRFSEWILGAIMLGLGLMFGLPSESMGHAALMQMTHTLTEETWAFVCSVLGASRLAVLILNGAWRKQSHGRAALAFISLVVWTQISIVFFNFGPPTPGDIIFPVFMLAEMFLVFRASVEAGTVDASLKHGTN